MNNFPADLRREYTLAGLRRADLPADPFHQFAKWFDEAVLAQVLEPNAMSLATADAAGQPSARTVLLKGFDVRGFVFFTNYQSRKGRELEANPRAGLLILWRELERQVVIGGAVAKVSREESEDYFKARPEGSRLSAWASRQSEVVPDRDYLEQQMAQVTGKFAFDSVPCPPHWGGYLVAPEEIEFWQGRPDRLHDRFRYTRMPGGDWVIERLSP